jgi:hypothetical protein
MNTGILTLRKRWPALAAIAALLAVAVMASALFAANEQQSPDIHTAGGQMPSEPLTNYETDPGLTAEYRALVDQEAADQDALGAGVNQAVPGTGGSDALERWLAEQPETMGFITREDAIAADPATMDWLLYQAVYKDVLTREEADAVQAWYERRPSAEEAPELLNHQPAYLHRPGDDNSIPELFQGTESR